MRVKNLTLPNLILPRKSIQSISNCLNTHFERIKKAALQDDSYHRIKRLDC
jgi:hypothetical protein